MKTTIEIEIEVTYQHYKGFKGSDFEPPEDPSNEILEIAITDPRVTQNAKGQFVIDETEMTEQQYNSLQLEVDSHYEESRQP